MTTPLSSFQGLASGIQWRDLVDQIIEVESVRALGPVSRARTAESRRIEGWSAIGAALAKARDALATLRDASAFRSRTGTVAPSATSGRTLATLGTVTAATPGRYAVEVEQLAQAERLSGLAVADATAALGIDGRVSVNGVAVTIEATDSLERIRDKFNAANTGAAPSRVSASITSAGGVARLILSADRTGTTGLELADDRSGTGATSTLEALGLVDGSRALNTGTDGRVRSMRISSSTLAAAAALGINVVPSPATIVVNGRTLTVDLEQDSLTDIVARINALSPGAAEVESEADGGTTWSRLAVAGTLASDGSAASELVLEALGLRVGGRSGGIAQALTFDAGLTGLGGATVTAGSLLTDLGVGAPAGVQAGDVITMTGTDGAGNAVSMSYTVTGTDTVADLMAAMSAAFAPGRAADVALVDGRLVVTDGTTGDSALQVRLSAGLQSGGTLDFGDPAVTFGRVRQLATGMDAQVRIDGARLTSRTNTIAGAVGGASLTLTGAEDGTTFDVTIASSPDTAVSAVQGFVAAYNELLTAVTTETAAKGRLPFASSARAVLGSLKGLLLANQVGLADGAPYRRGGDLGLQLQKDGRLALDTTALRAALESDPAAVEALFAAAGASPHGSVAYVGAADVTPGGTWSLAVTRAATRSAVTGTAFTTYTASATPASMTVTSESGGRSATIALATGDTPAIVAARLNAAFTEDGVAVTAEVVAGALRLRSTDYGSAGGFTIAYADPGAEGPAAQLGLAAGTIDTGLDAAATLDGVAMTGSGQLLTAANGLVLRYTGTDDALVSSVRYARGLAGALTATANAALAAGDGTIALQEASAQTRIASLERRETDIADRLERRRLALIADFTRMEAALARLQGQGNWLAAQITTMNAVAGARGR